MSTSLPSRLALLVCAAAALPGASDDWTVPTDPGAVSFHCPGEVTLDRGRVITFPAGGKDLIIDWAADHGAPVRAGDPLVIFDARLLCELAETRADELTIADRTLELNTLTLEQQLAVLLSTQADTEADLRTCQAAIAAVAVTSTAAAGVARAEGQLAELRAATTRRHAEAGRRLAATGQESLQSQADLEQTAEIARLETSLPRLRAALAAAGDPVKLATLQLKEKRLRQTLGIAEDGAPDPTSGLTGQIRVARSQQDRQRVADQLEHDRALDAYHQAIAEAYDHTPLIEVSVDGVQPRHIAFLPKADPPPTGYAIDHGEAYADGRGYGWTTAAPMVRRRDPGATTPGATPTSGAPGVAVSQGLSRWRLRLADGSYHLTARFGDAVDWRGAVARVVTASGPAPAAFFVADHLQAGELREVSTAVTVRGGWLELQLGDEHPRAIRAPGTGVALRREWIGAGWRTSWREDPVAFFANPGQSSVLARVPIPWVPMLCTASAAHQVPADEGVVAAARSRLATARVTITTPQGVTIPGTVSDVIQQPILPWRAPPEWGAGKRDSLDATANQVDIAIAEADGAALPVGCSVEVTCTITLLPGMHALPSQLVTFADSRAWIQRAGAEHAIAVPAFRLGDRVIAVEGVTPGMRLVVPTVSDPGAPGHRFPGEVIAGARFPVALPMSWGRIASLVAEGSRVEKGQVVVTLYNPSLDSAKGQREQERRRANQAYLLTAESRRLTAIQDANVRRDQTLSEEEARLAVTVARTPEALAEDAAANALEEARVELLAANQVLPQAEALKRSDPGRYQAAAVAAQLAGVTVRRRQLELVAASTALDWLGIQSAIAAWQDTVAAVNQRESAVQVTRMQDRSTAIGASLKLQQALTGNDREANFRRVKDMKATAAGRIFYLNGWNDQTSEVAKFQKDFYVWGGLTVAEILDMSHLSFHAELPESRWRSITVGQEVTLRFPQFDDRSLPARISKLGRMFALAKDHADSASTVIGEERVFTVTIDFQPPSSLADLLVPGTSGVVEYR